MNSFNIKQFISFFAFCLIICKSGQCQNKFQASLFSGITAAQLGGDSLTGYNKLGFTFGARLSYPVSDKLDLSTELVFNQKGSRKSLGFAASGENFTTLNYLEIPLIITLNDWFIEKGKYYKVGLFGGMSYGYLFSVQTNSNILRGRESEFNKSDISARLGVYYSFSKALTFRTFYSDSFSKLLSGDLFNTDSLDSFYWTFRIEYKF